MQIEATNQAPEENKSPVTGNAEETVAEVVPTQEPEKQPESSESEKLS